MSYRVEIMIVCDYEQCRERLVFHNINEGGLSKTWAGAMAASKGWYSKGQPGSHDPKVAYCPEHRKVRGL